MELDPALRCAVCQRPLAMAGGRLRCSGLDCPLQGADQDTCCGGAPLTSDAPVGERADACPTPPVRVRWRPED